MTDKILPYFDRSLIDRQALLIFAGVVVLVGLLIRKFGLPEMIVDWLHRTDRDDFWNGRHL